MRLDFRFPTFSRRFFSFNNESDKSMIFKAPGNKWVGKESTEEMLQFQSKKSRSTFYETFQDHFNQTIERLTAYNYHISMHKFDIVRYKLWIIWSQFLIQINRFNYIEI